MGKQRVVVKIGSSSLTNSNGGLSTEKLQEHVQALSYLKEQGNEVVLISSGAVAAGFGDLGYPSRPVTISGKQAAAAVGQGLLMQGYTKEFSKNNINIAQLLLTRQNFSQKDQYKNVYQTITELLKRGVLPIINENDSVAVDELTFGDNDMLSALVSGLIHADCLMILTDINGLYDKNPHKDPAAKKYTFLPKITEELQSVAKGSSSNVGTGGMKSKIEAAERALSLGVNTFIGSGAGPEKLTDILEGKGDGTYIGNSFLPPLKNKKQWIMFHSKVTGKVEIDEGAAKALLQKGKSLLSVGVTSVYGEFSAGDVVEVINSKGDILGRGQVDYNSCDLLNVKGETSQSNGESTVVIHRNLWVKENV
ncbi:glutamate 5-kinase [Pontibacillus sp. HMF3514]|uniref:glutamate 5-kinase n=1 Tax=Pontibacillus sp. HMF3514 TaxID=2692425 RepID=UPI00131F59B7|nr:glutamate 5-kinase [Pontibacillus sp. HMF3514]QHE52849.1 glutamate 5-kinase [Pontibacillus sp. HMF3514]